MTGFFFYFIFPYRFEQRLKQIHPEKRKPVIVDVHEIIVVFDPYAVEEYVKLPSLKELKQSHNKLRELCMPGQKQAYN